METLSREQEIDEASNQYVSPFVFPQPSANLCFKKGAEWADEHPRKELWTAEKFIKFIRITFTETISGNVISRTNTTIDEVIENLCKNMFDL